MLLPHQQRVVEERDQLADKVANLRTLLYGKIFRSLSDDEQTRLVQQLGFMEAYARILEARIDAFEQAAEH